TGAESTSGLEQSVEHGISSWNILTLPSRRPVRHRGIRNDRKGCMKRDWMLGLTALIASFTSGSPASAQTASASPTSPPNPFYSASTLQFESPPFDKIRDSDYQPAIEEGMKQQLAEIEAIAAQSEPPTFANTIEGMERTGVLLTRVTKVFVNLAQS